MTDKVKKKRFMGPRKRYAAAKEKKDRAVKVVATKIDSFYRKIIATLFGIFFGSSGVGYIFLGIDFAYSIAMFFLAAIVLVLISLLITWKKQKNNEESLREQLIEEKKLMREEHQKQLSEQHQSNLHMTEAILEKMYQILETIADGTWDKTKIDYRIHSPSINNEIYEGKKGIKRVRPLEFKQE